MYLLKKTFAKEAVKSVFCTFSKLTDFGGEEGYMLQFFNLQALIRQVFWDQLKS